MKRLASLLLTAAVSSLFVLTSCGTDSGKIKIGILQYATHEALDSARTGFVDRLAELGYGPDKVAFTVKNPQSDPDQMNTMASSFESGSYDLVYGIATPAAIALKSVYDGNRNQGPILFSAVTDAVEAGLVTDAAAPGGNITGTVDMNPVAAQVRLLTEVDPDIGKIGVLYTQSEPNSQIQADLVAAECEKLQIEVVTRTIGSVNDLQTVASSLVKSVDALYLPTDNIVASAMATITTVLKDAEVQIPVCCGETNMTKAGGLLTLGLDYEKLGRQTADMAAQILSGAKTPAELPVESQKEFDLVVNLKYAEEFGLTVPQDLIDRADIVVRD